MFTLTLYLSFVLRLLFSTITVAATAPPPYVHTDYFLLDCGSLSNSSDGQRNWESDAHSPFSSFNLANTSFESKASEQIPSVPQVPYMTARLFLSKFTYTFPVTPGPKFLRLYFYPATYSGLNKSNSFFSVSVSGDFTLLQNFSAFLTVASINPTVYSLVKEFIVKVRENQRLSLTFSPNPNSHAFINGIEVVSLPDKLYLGQNDNRIKLVGLSLNNFFYFDKNTALETLYRLNMGGNDIPIINDSGMFGMFRSWVQDDKFLNGGPLGFTPYRSIPIEYTAETPPYTAPESIYTISRTMDNFSLHYNLTWYFPVDSGFYYLLRLHFCDVIQEITLPNQRVFWIFINNRTAERQADVIQWSGGSGIPVFRDYVVWVPNSDGSGGKQDLWLAMHPNMETYSRYANAILNGLEIFKLNASDGNLAAPNPELVLIPPPPAPYVMSANKRKSSFPFVAVIGGVAGGIATLFLILCFLAFRRGRRGKNLGTTDAKSSWEPISFTSRSAKTGASALPSDLCRRFSLAEIKSATADFDENFVIGTGGFGSVYKAYIENGTTTVAIKRLNASSNQGIREFETEILMLSKLRHLHLVSLIGYCDDDGEMLLVYDYMAHGTLRDHLYKTNNPPLSWKQRLQICIGAARGLHYLHTGTKCEIIHRDVKSTNILLDEKWVAKVSDFGLSKLGPSDTSKTHVTTVVKGSIGYLDPEYYRRQQLTAKSDVYSFGVVLFEVLCARPPIMAMLPKEQINLVEWARECYLKGTLDQIIDQNLRVEVAPECLKKFGEVAYSCVRDQGIERPTMNDVVWSLEFALQLQEASDKASHVVEACGSGENSPVSRLLFGETTTTDDDNVFSGSAEHVSRTKSSGTSTTISDGFKSPTVFSEIMNPTSR